MIELFNIIERITIMLLILCLSPVFLIISIIIKLDSKGPVIFKQERIGKNSRPFYIYKFRSMKIDAPSNIPTCELEADKYITSLGNFLRKTSLDELPQLFNIVKGEMSLVGPRPVIPKERKLIELRKKHGVDKVLPGLTGWAQINGRDKIGSKEKVKYDRQYVENKSLNFDIYIIWITACKVIKGEDIVDGNLTTKYENNSYKVIRKEAIKIRV
jgi:O-antigen biosynthesis protein WbqP